MEERETKIVKVDLIYTESLLISWGIGKLVLNVYTTMVIRYLIRHTRQFCKEICESCFAAGRTLQIFTTPTGICLLGGGERG